MSSCSGPNSASGSAFKSVLNWPLKLWHESETSYELSMSISVHVQNYPLRC